MTTLAYSYVPDKTDLVVDIYRQDMVSRESLRLSVAPLIQYDVGTGVYF